MPQRFALQLVSVFGLGHMRPASGTWGSLPPVVIAAMLLAWRHYAGGPQWAASLSAALLLLVFSLACIAYGEHAERKWGKDPKQVVADEVAGQALALILMPAGCFATPERSLAWLVASFVLFRALDIVKPWPARGLQRVRGGWGILIDDLFAGAYAGLALHLFARYVVHA